MRQLTPTTKPHARHLVRSRASTLRRQTNDFQWPAVQHSAAVGMGTVSAVWRRARGRPLERFIRRAPHEQVKQPPNPAARPEAARSSSAVSQALLLVAGAAGGTTVTETRP